MLSVTRVHIYFSTAYLMFHAVIFLAFSCGMDFGGIVCVRTNTTVPVKQESPHQS
jgi:hypothetical protein